MKSPVHGRTVVITGAARGFGEGIARILASEGANVVIADLNAAAGEAVAASINGAGLAAILSPEAAGAGKAAFVRTDVTDEQSVKELMDRAVALFGRLDVVISNAGIVKAGSLDQLTPEDIDAVAAVNYRGYFLCAKYASAIMKAQTAADPDLYCDIIQINSKSGLQGSRANSAYSGSKFGGIGLTQSFALELAPFRIKVNSICPGNYLDGPLWSDPDNGLFLQYLKAGKVPGARTVEDVREHYLSKVPMHKGCTPEDVAKAILYAIAQTCETGQSIPVTGGQVML